ncbi:MAG: hypothetical protein M1820_009247 [Bogoriella megaspora]|nr:MAG: hypothetical protein M1820_009247 [Bogoriella megaspora]
MASLEAANPRPILPFWKLPLEIREAIYEKALSLRDVAPSSPKQIRNCELRGRIWIGYENLFESCTRFDPQPPKASITGLLLSNHQTQDEVKDLIRRKGVMYRLNILISEERLLFPTWTLTPFLSKHADRLDVVLQIYDPRGANVYRGRSKFRYRDGSPELMIWPLCHILRRYLERGADLTGPCGEYEGQETPYIIGILSIDVESPSEASPMRVNGPAKDPVTGILRPEWLMDHIWWGMNMVLYGDRDARKYGRILFKGVLIIEISRDGTLSQEIDLKPDSMIWLAEASWMFSGN